MSKCPNCGRETARTMDWACQWCGYPLLSKAYKKIPKTYKQLKAEKLFKQKPPEPEPEPMPELEPEPEPEPVPKLEPELMAEPEPKPTPEPEPELMAEPEPEPTPEPEPELMAEPEPEPARGPEAEPILELEPEPTSTEIEVTVGELHSAYGDKITADAKLMDKILKVTGIVDKIVVNDMYEIYYIILTSAERKEEWHVRCTFDKKDGPELNRLTTGQTVTVQGKYDGYRINILLRDCVLAP